MDDLGDYLRSVVRVFPDHAGTALWFVDGPLDYADARVSESLTTALTAWEESYYGLLDDNFEWRADAAVEEFLAEGDRLAALLMAELGDAFEVEYRFDSLNGTVRGRGTGAGTNSDAVAALRAMAAAHQAQHERMRELRALGGEFRWTAHAPLSGHTFTPMEGDDVPDLPDLIIREATADDTGEIEAVQAAAFGDHASVVIPLLRSLIAHPASPCALSLVAVLDDRVVGHVLFTRSILDAPERLVDVSVLSPIAVHPNAQARGIGGELIAAGLAILADRGVPLVFLEGSPRYYGGRGFAAASPLEFRSPSLRIPDAAFQVAILPAHESWMTGTLVYDQAFWDHDAVGLRE